MTAAANVGQRLAGQRVAQAANADYRHEQFWTPSWSLVPVMEQEATIDDFNELTRERLERVLVDKEFASATELRQADIGRLMRHWAHTFVMNGIQVHRQSEAAERLAATTTPEDVLMITRMSLWQASAHKHLLMTTPAHPLWGKRGKIISHEGGEPLCSEEVNKGTAKFAQRLLGQTMGISRSLEGPAIGVMREAVPELLSVDRGYLAEIDSQPRRNLIALLSQLESFTPETRAQTVGLIADIWDAVNTQDTANAYAAQEEGMPDFFTEEIDVVYRAYFKELLEGDGPIVDGKKGLLEKRMPVLSILLLRSYLEKNAPMMATIGAALQKTLKNVVLRTPLSRLSLTAYTAMMPECTPKQLLATI